MAGTPPPGLGSSRNVSLTCRTASSLIFSAASTARAAATFAASAASRSSTSRAASMAPSTAPIAAVPTSALTDAASSTAPLRCFRNRMERGHVRCQSRADVADNRAVRDRAHDKAQLIACPGGVLDVLDCGSTARRVDLGGAGDRAADAADEDSTHRAAGARDDRLHQASQHPPPWPPRSRPFP